MTPCLHQEHDALPAILHIVPIAPVFRRLFSWFWGEILTPKAPQAALLVIVASWFAPACASAPRPPGQGAPIHIDAQPRIVTADEVTTEAELAARAERALMEQRWQDAADAYATLLAAAPAGPHAPQWMFELGLALEGLERRA